MAGVKRAARWLEAVVVVGIILLIVAVTLPPAGNKTKAREAEVKQNLHSIQLAVERYAVDHDGAYPAYLVGGEACWSAEVNVGSATNAFTGQVSCQDIKQVADPLLREGYLSAYPRNPFTRDGREVHKQQLSLPLALPGGDPLRNGADTGRVHGTRFGSYCMNMGQVLGAKYYCQLAEISPSETTVPSGALSLNITGQTTAPIPGLPPGADAAYPCWDVWQGQRPANPLPGQFIYAGTGPGISFSGVAVGGRFPILPAEIDSYILAAFGGPRTKGQDKIDSQGIPLRMSNLPVQPPGGSIASGNSNGIRDGIILLLEAGTDGRR